MTTQSTQPQQPGQPVVYITQNPGTTDSIGQAAQQQATLFYKLGITQVCLSGVVLTLGITILVYSIIYQDFGYYPNYNDFYYDWYGQIATGVWTSCFFFTSGLLGILSGQRKNRCLVVAGLTMAIFSALAAVILVGFEIAGSVYSFYEFYYYDSRCWKVSFGIHICLASLGLAEFVIAIVHAAYCCNGNCCGSSQSCCMPTNQQTNSGAVTYTYANTNAFQQIPTNQPVYNYYQVAPGQSVANPQFIQQPYIMTSGAPQQQIAYQIPYTVQTSTEKPPI